jgi:hypothetical protein
MSDKNREARRHPERPPASPEDKMRERDRQQDDLSVRAKNSGHGKKTADKWNQ